jgi:hypothetical protein
MIPFGETSSRKEFDDFIRLTSELVKIEGDIVDFNELVDAVKTAARRMVPRFESQLVIGSGISPEFSSMKSVTSVRQLCVENPGGDVLRSIRDLLVKANSINKRTDFVVMSRDTYTKAGLPNRDGVFYLDGARIFINQHAGCSVYAGLWIEMDAENGVCIALPIDRENRLSICYNDFGLCSRMGALELNTNPAFNSLYESRKFLDVRAYLGLAIKGSGVFRMDGF